LNSIFLRIYGGMLAAVLVVGSIAYGTVQLVNSYRADIYREQMARGTFYLMARGLQRQQTPEELERWRLVLGRLMSADIQLRVPAEVDFNDEEQRRLAEGRVLMRLHDGEGHADIYFQLPGEERYLSTRMTRVSEQQARATALLILDELSQFPTTRWDEEFARIQRHFGYPLNRVPFEKVNLDREQLLRLERREVVLAIDESASREQSSVMVYAPIGSTGKVLVMGPMRLFEKYPVQMLVIVGSLGLAAMGLTAYLLVRPLQNRLFRLGSAVERLGRGDFNARADASSQDAIGQLASTFNGMTAHIRRLIESQREMTRAVSHELRTPVARLRFGLEMLADIDDADVRRTKVEALDRDIDQLDELIDEILTFARLEEGSPAIDFAPIAMPLLLLRLKEELSPISAGIDIHIDDEALARLAPEDAHAAGSERYLHRVLQNLVTNALRYAAAQVVLRYRVDGDLAVLEVEDDGPGIPEDDRERIFKPFARLDESRQRKSGGYGLGLSIVQRIAEWHGGRVTVHEGAHGGALFRMVWPRQHRVGAHVLGHADNTL
jgi:two-component system, OmpR family, sensor histidine kinase RstB